MDTEKYEFLGEDENVEHVLATTNISFYVTNKRLLIDRNDKKSKIYLFDEIDYKYIAFLNSETRVGRDWRPLGALLLIFGIVLIISGYQQQYAYIREYNYVFIIIGVLLIIGGIMAFLISPKTESKLLIELSGVPKERIYRITAPVKEMQLLLTKINENRSMYDKRLLKESGIGNARAKEIS